MLIIHTQTHLDLFEWHIFWSCFRSCRSSKVNFWKLLWH